MGLFRIIDDMTYIKSNAKNPSDNDGDCVHPLKAIHLIWHTLK